MSKAVHALNDLADEVAAAAELDEDARQWVDDYLDVGIPEVAISDALTRTTKPLPPDLLKRIRAGVDAGWYYGVTRDDVIAALNRQSQGGPPPPEGNGAESP